MSLPKAVPAQDASRAETMSEKHAFINRLRSMTCIDGWQLPELPKHEQLRFMADPFGFLMRADAAQSDAIWREIEKRQG